MTHKKYLEYRDEDGMLGPFWFESSSVEAIDGRTRGVYLLTHEARGPEPRLVVVYVGRGRVRDRLGAHLVDEDGGVPALRDARLDSLTARCYCRVPTTSITSEPVPPIVLALWGGETEHATDEK